MGICHCSSVSSTINKHHNYDCCYKNCTTIYLLRNIWRTLCLRCALQNLLILSQAALNFIAPS